MCCPKAMHFYALPSPPSTHTFHKHSLVVLRKQAAKQTKEWNQVTPCTFENTNLTSFTCKFIFFHISYAGQQRDNRAFEQVKKYMEWSLRQCDNLPCSSQVRLGSLPNSFNKQREASQMLCSFGLFSPWNLVRVVKDDSDRHLEKRKEIKSQRYFKAICGDWLCWPAHAASTGGEIRFHHYSSSFTSVGQQGKVFHKCGKFSVWPRTVLL